MPRKLKFYRPINYERKKLSFVISIKLQDVTVLPLSIPRQLIQVPRLILSLPVSAYTTAPIADLHHLCSRLSAHSLPDGRIIHVNDTHNDLILSSLTIDALTLLPTTTYIIKVVSFMESDIHLMRFLAVSKACDASCDGTLKPSSCSTA